MNANTLLTTFGEAYWKTRDARTGWRDQLRYVAVHYGKFLGRPATLADLTVDSVNDWIAWMCEGPLSRWSVRSKRRVLLVLWRAASDRDLVPMLPERKIRKVKAPPLIPKSWSIAEMQKLLAVAAGAIGRRQRNKPAEFWKAWILVSYQTGLRPSDQRRLRFDDIQEDGSFTIIQSKTGFPITCFLEDDAMAAVNVMRARGTDLVFPMCMDQCHKQFGELVRLAGLKGTLKTLRKTGATLCEVATPGSASAFLGHRDPGLAVRHYLDPSKIQAMKARPPRLT